MKIDFEEILNHVNNAIIVLDKKWRFTFVNEAALKNSPNKNIIGRNIWKEFPQFKNTALEKSYRRAMRTQKSLTLDFEGPLSKRMYKFTIHPSAEGLTVFSVDITDKKITEDNLKQVIKEKELLIKEAHHRIKNNLQLVSSLLNFQIKKIRDKNIQNIFKDTQNRITSISIIHKGLYHSSSLAFINIQKLLNEFIENLVQTLVPDRKRLSISKKIDSIVIHSDLGVAISLITNELVTNSIKYAYREKEKVNISVILKDVKDQIILIIKDNGPGLMENVDVNSPAEGIGFRIINALVQQHNGSFSYSYEKGSKFTINFLKNSENKLTS
jgi:two-component sensor histidine kinase